MTYEALLEYADTQNLIVREKYIPGYAGRIYDNRIAIHKDIKTQSEKACVLAEELGHYHTNYGDVLDQSDIRNRKQEYKARLWDITCKLDYLVSFKYSNMVVITLAKQLNFSTYLKTILSAPLNVINANTDYMSM